MSKVLISLCLMASLLGVIAAETSSEVQAPETFIIGGTTANILNFPYHVSVQRFGAHICSGVIFRNSLIITTASCVSGTTPTSLRIRAGSAAWNTGGVMANVFSYLLHPNYNPQSKANDIALLRLTTALISSTSIKPVLLASVKPADGGAATISGWGVTSYGGATLSATLQTTTVNLISRAECTQSYGNTILPTMLCADNAGKAACDGDSGSPLVAGGLLIGIYSWSNACGVDGYPGVYTDITQYASWIIGSADNNLI